MENTPVYRPAGEALIFHRKGIPFIGELFSNNEVCFELFYFGHYNTAELIKTARRIFPGGHGCKISRSFADALFGTAQFLFSHICGG